MWSCNGGGCGSETLVACRSGGSCSQLRREDDGVLWRCCTKMETATWCKQIYDAAKIGVRCEKACGGDCSKMVVKLRLSWLSWVEWHAVGTSLTAWEGWRVSVPGVGGGSWWSECLLPARAAAGVLGEIRVSYGRDEDDDVAAYGWSIWWVEDHDTCHHAVGQI